MTVTRRLGLVLLCVALGIIAAGLACGGTNGRDGLTTPTTDSGSDATLPDGGLDALPPYDSPIVYADQILPDVSPPPEAGPEAEAGPCTTCLAPCTADAQANCVQCQGNKNNLCTPTEAVLVQIDIDSKIVTKAGPDDSATSCYGCMVKNQCIDSDMPKSVGQECGDFTGDFSAGNTFSGMKQDICLATLQCLLGPAGGGCVNAPMSGGGIENCYCGTDGTSGPVTSLYCNAHGSAVNGPCLVQEANGFTFAPTDSADISTNFVDTSGNNPSGVANSLVSLAIQSGCSACTSARDGG